MENTTINTVLEICQDIVNEKLNLIEGCQLLMRAMSYIEHIFSPLDWERLYYPILALESETDNLPTGRAREHCSKEWLAKADLIADKYIKEDGPLIKEICREIIIIIKSENY